MAKTIRKTIRFSEDEFAKIESQLNSSGKSFSDFAREVLLTGKVSRVRKADPDLLYHLNRIGNNLNQIARAVNAKDDKIQILTELVEIERHLKDLKNVY